MSTVVRCLFLAAALSSLQGALCSATEIKVRLIDVVTGQAVRDAPVWLYLADEKLFGEPMKGKTGPDGQVAFTLPVPLPVRVVVIGDVSGSLRQCSSGIFDVQELLDQGIVGNKREQKCNHIQSGKTTAMAPPGEVIVFVRALNWWERMQK